MHSRSKLLIVLALLLSLPVGAQARGLGRFIKKDRPTTGQQKFLGPFRLGARVGKLLGKMRWTAKRIRDRKVIQVTNGNLDNFVKATAKGYLEVVVPAGKGHVYFRHGKEVFDFYPGGFRVGGVRPVGSERYGMLIPLTRGQDKRVKRYLKRLKESDGKELGKYDFHGEKGFHCVSWIMRLAMDSKGSTLAQTLGSRKKTAGGMPSFSRFMLRKARPVSSLVLYNDAPKTSNELSRMSFNLMSSRQIRRAFRDETFR